MRLLWVVLAFAIIQPMFLLYVEEACAYIDPGAGSYAFQLLIAFAVGGLFALKVFWGKIVLFFRNLFSGGKR